MEFANQAVLVTGASRGIGRAVARQFAEHGARVAVHYRSNAEAAAETLRSLPGGPHMLVAADLADEAAADQLVARVVAELGRLDVLVNNAGIFELHPVAAISYDEWRRRWHRTVATNLLAPANLCYCAARLMIEQGGGRIVNVSSRGAFRGEPEAPAYGASKAGLNAMSQSLAVALAKHRIYVYVVAPGWVDTDMAAPYLSGPGGASVRQQSPLGRIAHPDEVARTVLFLAGKGTEYLTGCIVDVNGASYLRS